MVAGEKIDIENFRYNFAVIKLRSLFDSLESESKILIWSRTRFAPKGNNYGEISIGVEKLWAMVVNYIRLVFLRGV